MNLIEYLSEKGVSDDLQSIVVALSRSVMRITLALRQDSGGKAGTQNVYGEDQIKMDVLSNKIVMDELAQTGVVGALASEELPHVERLKDGNYGVCFDPLDGSSLADVNLSVGSIFGIYKAVGFIGLTGDDQVASMVAIYGPRTTIVLTVRKGVVEFTLNEMGEFVLTHDNIKIAEEGKMFAPGNLRACAKRPAYLDLMNFWCKQGYKLRYSGGMVPDLNQILIKGKGIFTYPGFSDQPNGKLRLLHECAPCALIVEQAGGAASTGSKRVLDVEVMEIDQCTPILIGGKEEVYIAQKFLAE